MNKIIIIGLVAIALTSLATNARSEPVHPKACAGLQEFTRKLGDKYIDAVAVQYGLIVTGMDQVDPSLVAKAGKVTQATLGAIAIIAPALQALCSEKRS